MAIRLEAPVYTLEAALSAADYGVDRLELCADFGEGGTTPSAGMLAHIKASVDIPVFVMIRPRGGDFVYSEGEIEVMKRDIAFFKSLGADGFVFGVLDKQGNVDRLACSRLLQAAGDSPCTFHRAIDAAADGMKSLEDVISLGFARVLTSGGMANVTEGLAVVKQMMQTAGERIIVIPGGGTLPTHLDELATTGFLREVHASCKAYRSSESQYFNPHLSLSEGNETVHEVLTIDQKLVEAFKIKM
ncbi:MAG TPA: copper homeostasis protein CutC [Cyclobacteriaceae bacterium]|nr:copper homeostasis protein CutC [Cyclobacteriaceae bacterium]